MLLRRCTDTEIRFGNSLSYLPSHSQACLTLHCQQLRPVGHRKAVRIQHRPGTGKAFCVRRGHAFLPGRASGKMEISMALLGLLEAYADIQRAAPPKWEPGQEGRTLRRLDITIRKMKSLHG